MTTLLIVEDEPQLATLVRDYGAQSGFQVRVAATAGEAATRFRQESPDIVVLDLGLPDRDGLDVLREIRRAGNTPVIILTARGDETDRIVGLELGADDYMVKPFSPRELMARIRAILRRGQASEPDARIRAGDVEIDLPRRKVTRDGTVIDLTATEFGSLRTRHRCPHQEPAPQTGTGHDPSPLRTHRARRRLQVHRRCVTADPAHHGGQTANPGHPSAHRGRFTAANS
jgi:DNA-binding response OmpR family regulator